MPPGRRHMPGDTLLDRIRSRLPKGYEVKVCDLFDLPSTELRLREMLEIARAADGLCGVEADGVVVSHGTATLEETAYLTDLIAGSTKSVVFTGAMRRFDRPKSDGPENLCDAIIVAGAPARGTGTTVAFARAVYAASEVTKVHSASLNAFGSPEFGPLARIVHGRLEWLRIPATHPPTVGPIGAYPRVEIVKCYGGMTEFMLEAALAARLEGLVVEGFGGGEVPPSIIPSLERLSEEGTYVAITTAVPVGPLRPAPKEESETWYRSPLRAKKLRIRLWLGLASGLRGEHLRSYVEH